MVEWWEELLTKAGHTQTSLQKKTGVGQTHLSRYFKGERNLKPEQAQRVAQALGTTADFLLSRNRKKASAERSQNGNLRVDRRERPRIRMVAVKGMAGAGWVDSSEQYDLDEEVGHVAGQYENVEQFAFKVSGNSMDAKRIFDGDYVVCIPYWLHRTGLGTGDTVVIERQRGQLTERSVREVVVTSTHYEFWPRSTDPRFNKPTVVIRQDGTSILNEADDTEVRVIGLVIWRGGRVSP